MPRSSIDITGLGVVSSIGIGTEAFFESLLKKRSGIRSLAVRTDDGAKPPEDELSDGFWIGGPIIDFEPKQFVRPRKSLKVMCREIQTAFAASQLAIDHAGLADLLPADESGQIDPAMLGTVFGSEMFYGTPVEVVDAVQACRDGDGEVDAARFGSAAMKNIMPLWMLKYLPNMPACHIGIAINSQGPNNSLVLGDVSGPAATIEATSCIERGVADVMIAGATGSRISTTRLNYRGNLPLAAPFNPIEHSSRPHDPESAGVVGSEGAAAVVLESAEHRQQRGGKRLAELVAYANCFVPSEGFSKGTTTGNRGARQAIQQAIEVVLQDADIKASDIGIVVSHASGDVQSDASELAAVRAVLAGRPVVAPIASIGHAGAASGAFELATAILSLMHGTVPPTIGAGTYGNEVGFRDEAEPLNGDHALCITHTAEGNAIVLVLRTPRT